MPNINPNATTSLSQTVQIKAALLAGETLTPLDALNRFGCFRLGARIADIKAKYGLNIKNVWAKLPNGKRVAAYKIA